MCLHGVLVYIQVAALGLEPHKHLGKSIRQLQPHLHRLRDRFGCNVCGEGGEYETLTLDCPAFKQGRIVLDSWEVRHKTDAVTWLKSKSVHAYAEVYAGLHSMDLRQTGSVLCVASCVERIGPVLMSHKLCQTAEWLSMVMLAWSHPCLVHSLLMRCCRWCCTPQTA